MNREILFKGKIKGTNDWNHGDLNWIRGDLIRELSTRKTYICDLDYFNEDTKLSDVLVEVEPETVCQYTNFNDKNDDMIFENDKVFVEGRIGIVIWKDCAWNIQYKKHENDIDYSYKFFNWFEKNDIERIGNIFDEENQHE